MMVCQAFPTNKFKVAAQVMAPHFSVDWKSFGSSLFAAARKVWLIWRSFGESDSVRVRHVDGLITLEGAGRE